MMHDVRFMERNLCRGIGKLKVCFYKSCRCHISDLRLSLCHDWCSGDRAVQLFNETDTVPTEADTGPGIPTVS